MGFPSPAHGPGRGVGIELAFIALLSTLASCELVPFGPTANDQTLEFSASSNAIALTVPVPYYNEPQSELFISPKGAVSFGKALPATIVDLEANPAAAIAVLYAGASNGLVYYRSEPHDSELAQSLVAKVHRSFSDASEFKPRVVVIVTWDRLIARDAAGENQFQLILLSDARTSYAIMKFGKIEWTQTEEVYAQSGFYFTDGRNQKNVNAGSDDIRELVRLTNFKEESSFIFRVSGAHTEDPREGKMPNDDYEYGNEADYNPDDDDAAGACPPDPYKDKCPTHCKVVTDDRGCSLCICAVQATENELGEEVQLPPGDPIDESQPQPPPMAEIQPAAPVPQYEPRENEIPQAQPRPVHDLLNVPALTEGTCNDVRSHPTPSCSPLATCVDHETGFCCECPGGHIGNGRECVQEGSNVRVSGHYEGAINGRSIARSPMYSFLSLREGQQHTALAQAPPELGWSLLLLEPISDVMGWLFAKQGSENAYSGFQLTGGVFNRTVNMHLGDRYAIVIKQEFTGRQGQEYFQANFFISGTLPEEEVDTEVVYENFVDSYRRERPGFIRAYTERTIRLRRDGTERKMTMTVDQQIHFHECRHKLFDKAEVIKARSSRLNAQFTPDAIRFASQTVAIDPNDEPAQPASSDHHQSGHQHRQPVETGACAVGAHLCTQPHMFCEPIEQTYSCKCEVGFQPEIDDSVPIRFRCIPTPQRPLAQEVQPRPAVEAPIGPGHCRSHQECHQWGECVFTAHGSGTCKCRGWYVGDGVTHCGPPEPQAPPQAPQAPPQQPPQQPHYEHSPSQTAGTVCRGHEDCGEHANCVYSNQKGFYGCECVPPYKGDGVTCVAEVQAESCESRLRCDVNARCVFDPSRADSICQCVDGYEGNGVFCTLRVPQDAIVRPPADMTGRTECRDQTECHQNAHCVWAESTQRYFCECLPGFNGDGMRQCKSADQCNPSVPNACPPHAECTYGSVEQSYVCKCIQGFSGDGMNCVAHVQAPRTCDQDSALCHANAQCAFDTKLGRYDCKCKPGSTGDGYTSCVTDTGCYENRSLCHEHAQCVPGESGRYVCNCNYGYHGNGFHCYPDTEQKVETLLVGRGMSIIQRSTMPEQTGRQLVVIPHQVVVDIDYDCTTDKIYWSDLSNHMIRSASVNGTNLASHFEEQLKSPEGIAIDWSSQNLYYVDSMKDEIGVVSLNGKYQKALLKEGLVNPRALAIDLVGRKLYYSDWHRENPFIGRMDLDGKNNIVFVSQDIHLPNGLTVVQDTKELCWVDAGSQRLSCIGLDARNRRLVYAPLEYPFGLTIRNDDRFYWTDWKDHKVHTVSIAGQGYTSFTPSVGGNGKLYGITGVPSKCIGEPSPCATNNGGCDYLCLPGHAGVQCVCPDNATGLTGCP